MDHRSVVLVVLIFFTYFSISNEHLFHRHHHNGTRHKRQQNSKYYYVENSQVPEIGEWGPWSPAGECSRSCGGGVGYEIRECQSNRSEIKCFGPSKRYFSCNIYDCPDSLVDFRAQQCSLFDSVPFDGFYYSWIPYTKAPNKCELNCMPRNERFYYRHKKQVIDGTLCDDEKPDICVNGKCLPVGCDRVLGSPAREDKCRVCNGDGSSCSTIQGILDRNDLQVGYNDLLLIPAGAMNIRIQELQPSNNYLAIRNLTGFYYLNGNWRIDFPRSFRFVGTVFHYERQSFRLSAPESIIALGPITESLYIVMLYQEKNTGVEYEYSVPNGTARATDPDGYQWLYDDFSNCTAVCGGGFRIRNVWCAKRRDSSPVSTDLCDPALEPLRNQSCNQEPCAPQWVVEEWSECSHSCGLNGTQNRTVRCEQIISNEKPTIVENYICAANVGELPVVSRSCNVGLPCPKWFIGRWKPCDKLCGNGFLRRDVLCYYKKDGRISVTKDSACPEVKPEFEKPCFIRPCEGVDWIISEWSGCEDKCDLTTETRQVACSNSKGKIYSDQYCKKSKLPQLIRDCTAPACEYLWYATQWSECSSKCGSGIQTRKVFCATNKNDSIIKVEDSKCDAGKKYENTKNCTGTSVCKGDWFAGPWSVCSKACGGGTMTRKVFCFLENQTVEAKHCDPEKIIFSSESCNNEPCGEDNLIPVESNKKIFEEYTEEECEEYERNNNVVMVLSSLDKTNVKSLSMDNNSSTKLLNKSDEATTTNNDSVAINTELYDTNEATTKKLKRKRAVSVSEIVFSSGSANINNTIESTTNENMKTSTDFETNVIFSSTETISSASSVDSISFNSNSSTASSTVSFISSSIDLSNDTRDLWIYSSENVTNSLKIDSTNPISVNEEEASTLNISLPDESASTEMISSSIISESPDILTTLSNLITSIGSSKSSKNNSSTVEVSSSEISSTPASSAISESSDISSILTESTTKISSVLTTASNIVTFVVSPMFSNCSEMEVSSTSEISSTSASSVVSESSNSSSALTQSASPISSVLTSTSNVVTSTDSSMFFENYSSTVEESNFSETSSTSASSVIWESSNPSSTLTESTNTVSSVLTTALNVTSVIPLMSFEENSSETEESSSFKTRSTSASSVVSESSNPSSTLTESTSTVSSILTTASNIVTFVVSSMFSNYSEMEVSSTSNISSTSASSVVSESSNPSALTESASAFPSVLTSSNVTSVNPWMSSEEDSLETEGSSSFKTRSTSASSVVSENSNPSSILTEPTFVIPSILISSNFTSIGPLISSEINSSETEGSSSFGIKSTSAPSAISESSNPSTTFTESTSAITSNSVMTSFAVSEREKPLTKDFTILSSTENVNIFTYITKNASSFGSEAFTPESTTLMVSINSNELVFGNDTMNGPTTSLNFSLETKPFDSSTAFQTTPFTSFTKVHEKITPKICKGKIKIKSKCELSEFGCCSDGQTLATGPFSAGCPEISTCNETNYGCCFDGVTPANDLNYSNCEKIPCNETLYGCCPDEISVAIGNDYKGCLIESTTLAYNCKNSQFGCCPDGISTAIGPNWTGCFECIEGSGDCELCNETKYGCCPDGIGIAAGPNFAGCIEETTTMIYTEEYSTDSSTESSTSIILCQNSEFGCCDYNKTLELNAEECKNKSIVNFNCSISKYGCCSDGITFALGPNAEGCKINCSLTQYGCCSDGYTAALGEENEGCVVACPPPESNVSIKLEEICMKPKDRGSCREFTVKWFFDAAYGDCSRFWYGGCEGNENRFKNQDECRKTCVEPAGRDVCFLPKIPGPCDGSYITWYYDSNVKQCRQFTYGGCLGNNNRFQSYEECKQLCVQPEPCEQDVDSGPCKGNCTRWYFDKASYSCKEFTYGGCKGNQNNFLSEMVCQQQCLQSETTSSSLLSKIEICHQLPEQGSCQKFITSWYFDTREEKCRQFEYGGCGGNQNRFESEKDCESYCSVLKTEEKEEKKEEKKPLNSVCDEAQKDCEHLKNCPYGIEKWIDKDNCERCSCYNPCRQYECPADSQCAFDHYHNINGSLEYRPVCRLIQKPGLCPPITIAQKCGISCQTDADCYEEYKCCTYNCGSGCVAPVFAKSPPLSSSATEPFLTEFPVTEIFSPMPNGVSPPQIENNMETEIESEEGNYATLRCIVVGNPKPVITWQKGSTIIDRSVGRFKLTDGVLQIIGLHKNDIGIYTCTADNGIGKPAIKEFKLNVNDGIKRPAEIIYDTVSSVVVTLGAPTILQCYAYGYPNPTVTWWKEDKVLPTQSEQYEQRRDHSLAVYYVNMKALGPYTCQAYNGLGRAASWTLTLHAVGPVTPLSLEDFAYAVYLIPPPKAPPKIEVSQSVTPIITFNSATQHTFTVPIRTSIPTNRTTYVVGYDISIPCNVEGYPTPEVMWYKNDVTITNNEKTSFGENNQLLIRSSDTNDSGTYTCIARNKLSSSSSSITISVDGIFIHPNCSDNLFFAKCSLIVEGYYCKHKYYAKFCCKSCTLAGQLSPYGEHLNYEARISTNENRRYYRNLKRYAKDLVSYKSRKHL